MRARWILRGGRWSRGAVSVAAVAFTVGLTAHPSAARVEVALGTKVTTPAGYHRVTISQAGMTILVPDAWTKADLAKHPIKGLIRQLQGSDPQGATLLNQEHDALALYGLFAAVDAQGALGDQLTVRAVPSADGSAFIPTGRGVELVGSY